MSLLTQLSDKEFSQISGLVYDRFGISLGDQKRSLIVGRLNKVLHQNGFDTFEQYYEHLLSEQTGEALKVLVDRISTNHTFFYREPDHFEYLKDKVLPEISADKKKQGGKSLKIWCAGCSSGEESYTLAMIFHEFFGGDISSWDLGILATDISSQVLSKAQNGVYAPENVSRLPASLKLGYFEHRKDGQWEVKKRVRDLVLYRRLNLIADDYPFKGKFRIIFCRNVMIYFDKPTREALLRRFSRYLDDKGYLFIGHSESLGRSTGDFTYVKPAIYQKRSPQ